MQQQDTGLKLLMWHVSCEISAPKSCDLPVCHCLPHRSDEFAGFIAGLMVRWVIRTGISL